MPELLEDISKLQAQPSCWQQTSCANAKEALPRSFWLIRVSFT